MIAGESTRAVTVDTVEVMLALQYAARHGSFSLTELGVLMELAPDAATEVVRELVRGGLVLCRIRGRSSEHLDFFLTAAGRERARREGEAVVLAAQGLLNDLDPRERDVVEQALGLRLGEAALRDA